MNYLIIIDLNLNNNCNPKLKYKIYKLCKSREDSKYFYFFSKSENNIFKRRKSKCNIIIEREKAHFEYAFLSHTGAYKEIITQPKTINIIEKLINSATEEVNLLYKNLQTINSLKGE